MDDEREGWYNFSQQNNDIDALIGPQEPGEYQEKYVLEKAGDETVNDSDDCATNNIEKVKKTKKVDGDDEKLKHHRAAKYSDKQINWIENIKDALGTKSDSDALRWALDTVYNEHGGEIESIAKRRRRIGTL